MSFQVGDRVRVLDNYAGDERFAAGDTVIIMAADRAGRFPYEIKSVSGTHTEIVQEDELELEPQFVNVTTSRSIWVTLPGDNAGHRLTEDEARTLFRQLEEVV